MVTYGGMAKQPVIASVVSWWGRQTWRQGPGHHSYLNPGSAPLSGRNVYHKQYLRFLPLERQYALPVSTEPAHF